MIKKVLLSICTTVLLAMLSWGCHREPIKPSEEGLNGEITSEPIIVNGVETGYSLSYRSWIIPGEDNGSKSETAGKSGSSQDTVSVILHDSFYNVDTCAYVTDWDPAKYATYTFQWERHATVGSPENNITMIDSVAILRVQYQEFSFNYLIRFEVAHYDDGSYSCYMPHYSPVVTDLGAQELESMETVVKNGSVYARKLLRHSIRVAVGSTSYVLNATDTLYRHLPNANPSKFVVRSELVSEDIPSELLCDFEYETEAFIRYPYKCKFKQYYSDGTTGFSEVDLSTQSVVFVIPSGTYANNDNAHCENLMSLYDISSWECVPVPDNATTDIIDEYSTINLSPSGLRVNFSGEGITGAYENRTYLIAVTYIYDDGYCFFKKTINPTCGYSHKEKECRDDPYPAMRLNFYFNYYIENFQYECYTCPIVLNHL